MDTSAHGTRTQDSAPVYQLVGVELRLWQELDKVSELLAANYYGALTVLEDNNNPERFRQSAVSLRQIIDELPKLDGRVPVQDQTVNGLAQNVNVFKDEFAQLQVEDLSVEGEVSDEFKDKINRLIASAKKFVEAGDNNRKNVREQQELVIGAYDISLSSLPEEDRDKIVQRWMKIDKYLNGIVHKQGVVDEARYRLRITEFAQTLVDMMNPASSESYNQIDRIIQAKPSELSPGDFGIIRSRGDYYDYFFRNLKNPEFITVLEQNKFFSKANDPIRTKGLISFPFWMPAQYLIEVASVDPSRVMDIVLRIPETENQTVHAQLLEAAMKMPPNQAVRINPKLKEWLKNPNPHTLPMLSFQFVDYLTRNGKISDAVSLTRKLFELESPKEEGGDKKYLAHAKPLIHPYDIVEFIKDQFKALFEASPDEVTDVLIMAINIAVEAKNVSGSEVDGVTQDLSEIWLSDFENGLDTTYPEVYFSIALRNSILSVRDNDKKIQLLERLKSENLAVFRRIIKSVVTQEADRNIKLVFEDILTDETIVGESTVEFGSWPGTADVISDDELNSKTSGELIDFLNSWEPTREFMAPSRRDLAYRLSGKIAEDIDFGNNFIAKLDQINLEYHEAIYQGFATASQNKLNPNWLEIFAQIDKTLEKIDELDAQSKSSLLIAMNRAIEAGSNANQIDFESGRIIDINLKLIDSSIKQSDPEPENEDENYSNRDEVASYSRAKPVGLRNLITMLKRISRQRNTDENYIQKLPRELKASIYKVLSDLANPEVERSFSVRAVYVQNILYLWDHLSDWYTEHESLLFPKDRAYFVSSMESFILRTNIYFPIIDTIRPHLVRYMNLIKSGVITEFSDYLQRNLVGKILNYYIAGKIELNDDLMKKLLDLPKGWLSEAIEWFGRNLEHFAEDEDKRSRALAFWDTLKRTTDPAELNYFSLWFPQEGIPIEWRTDAFINVMKVNSTQQMIWKVFDWMIANVDKYPRHCAQVLDEVIRSQGTETLRYAIIRDLEPVIQSLSVSQDEEVKSLLGSIVNRMLQKRMSDFRKYL